MMKRLFLCLVSFLLLVFGCSCQTVRPVSRTLFALDTYCTVTAYGAGESSLDAVEARLAELEKQYSITEQDSLVSRVNRGELTALPEESAALLRAAQSVSRETSGAFDVTVAPLVDAYGYYTDDYRVPSDTELSKLLPLVGGADLVDQEGRLQLSDGQQIDLGGIAKGYIADCCIDVLREEGARGAVLSFGGNVAAFGTKTDGAPFTVAIADPEDPDAYLGTLQLKDASLVTAGAYQRGFYEDGVYYHHILDPKTGKPADSGLLSATVLCSDGARADALSTACFILGREGALDLWKREGGFELILVEEDGSILCTEGLNGNFTAEKKEVKFVEKNA